ncbi:SpoIIE family protein phosphatase [Streptomyces sp. AA1529]|uniref:SpoIIE family protein phosphatase n=1 Tax=Streptomyces sp. AA1529 TaxID=1203257 RepID=UPI003D764D5D
MNSVDEAGMAQTAEMESGAGADTADTVPPPLAAQGGGGMPHAVRTELPGNALAAGAARRFARVALSRWGVHGTPADDAVLLVSELVTNAVVHAGTSVGLECRYAAGVVYAEVADLHPARRVAAHGEEGHGLRLVGALAKEWGFSYRRDRKSVWFQLGTAVHSPDADADPDAAAGAGDGARAETAADAQAAADAVRETDAVRERPRAPAPGGTPAVAPLSGDAPREGPGDGLTRGPQPCPSEGPVEGPGGAAQCPAPRPPHRDWMCNGALSFLAEASDLLAGHTDEDKVASLAGQLMVPRFADWCAVWLRDDERSRLPRLARVWHAQEGRIEELRARLAGEPPAPADRVLPGQASPWCWPEGAAAGGGSGASARCDLVVGGRPVGTLVIGRAGLLRIPDEVLGLVEDFARRVALAVLSARRYALQENISRILQRGLLPSEEMYVPGLDTALVYEPVGEGTWAGGDFYDLLRLPDGRWRFALGDVCGNGPEAAVVTGLARPVLRLLAREGHSVPETLDRLNREVGEQARFLSVVYGELAFRDGLVDCTLSCAGHPLPLVRDAAGQVRTAALPQLLLGVAQQVGYECQSFTLHPGDTLLCVTDGVTERRCGRRLFDDGDGLAACFADSAGLDAGGTAERLRRAVYAFAPDLPADDLAMLVLRLPEAAGDTAAHTG